MAKIETIRNEVSYVLTLTEKELGTVVAGLMEPHTTIRTNAEREGIPCLGKQYEYELFVMLKGVIKQ